MWTPFHLFRLMIINSWLHQICFTRQRMLQSLVGIRRIRNVIGSMGWSLHYLNCPIQRRRLSIATTPPLVTITQTLSWFSRYLCLYRSREMQYNFTHLTTMIWTFIRGKSPEDCLVTDVGCGSRHTVCLTKTGGLWAFGWNKYGQLGVGDTRARDAVTRMMNLPKGRHVSTLR